MGEYTYIDVFLEATHAPLLHRHGSARDTIGKGRRRRRLFVWVETLVVSDSAVVALGRSTRTLDERDQ